MSPDVISDELASAQVMRPADPGQVRSAWLT
jgi:hypothetical protein